MKKYKKSLFVLLSALAITATTNVNAAYKTYTPSSNYKKTCITDGTAKDVTQKYEVSYEIGKTAGEYYLTAKKGIFKIIDIEEGYYNEYTDGFVEYPLSHLDGQLSDYVNNSNALIVGKDTTGTNKAEKVFIKAKSFIDPRTTSDYYDTALNGYEYALKITVALAKSDDLCQSPEDFQKTSAKGENSGMYTGSIYIMLKDFSTKTAAKVANTNYNLAACQTIRQVDNVYYNGGNYINVKNSKNENSLDNVAFKNLAKPSDANFYKKVNKYKELVPFCFSTADVVKNYSEAQVKTMVQTAIQSSYAIYLPQTVVKDQNWVASEQRACAATGGVWLGEGQCSATGENWQVLQKGQTPTVNNELYCKYEWKDLGEEDQSLGYKYTNINSYYAKSVEVSEEYYYYQYDGTDKVRDDQANKCTKVCEEVVDVEYGPPQAALAGFCIEYQVKVTSHVKCTTSLDIHAPKEGIVCQPTPNCVHDRYTASQAGPEEEFDICIQNCDGGKYSDTCSTKCYNEVYKSEKTNKLSADNKGMIKFVATRLEDIPTGGYYTREKTNNGYEIKWISTGGGATYAQWYIDNELQRTIKDHGTKVGTFFADSNGFKRKHNSRTNCNGVCSHINCADDTYLTQQRLTEDYQDNINRYNAIVNACAAQATCTEKTAEFKIAAKVNGKWINYPLNSATDKLVSHDDDSSRTENAIKPGSSLLSYAGCYNNGSEKNWYQAEWSFPGTWANNKTGEISYVDKGNDATWHQTKNKFCLPLTLGNTNKEWWYYYMNKKSNNIISSNKGSYISDEYKKTHPEIGNQNNTPSSNKIDWNIAAETMNFGYFHWKFKINCFYATYSQIGSGGTSVDNFTTRPIATNDIFPSTDPDNPVEVRNPSQTGRTQGYNWTSAATITENKNPYYAINPEMLITKIQTLGKKVYDDQYENEYVDYEFRLTPEALRIIKKNNESTNHGSGNYTNWSDSFRYDERKKVFIYTSDLFRGSGANNISKYAYKLPSENLLGCNNISRNQCEKNLGGN